MKTKTEIALVVLKYLALLGGIGFSIECGAELLYFISSFVNPGWSRYVYKADTQWFSLRDAGMWYYSLGMSIVIIFSALKATVWYRIFELLQKIQLQSPFSIVVARKLEIIAYFLIAIWVLTGVIFQTYLHYLSVDTGMHLTGIGDGNEYFFMAGIVFIISKIFRRGVEMQEENALTV